MQGSVCIRGDGSPFLQHPSQLARGGDLPEITVEFLPEPVALRILTGPETVRDVRQGSADIRQVTVIGADHGQLRIIRRNRIRFSGFQREEHIREVVEVHDFAFGIDFRRIVRHFRAGQGGNTETGRFQIVQGSFGGKVGIIGCPDNDIRFALCGSDLGQTADVPQHGRQFRIRQEDVRYLALRYHKGVDDSVHCHFRQVRNAVRSPEDGIRPQFEGLLRPDGISGCSDDPAVQVFHGAPLAPALRNLHRSDQLGQQNSCKDDKNNHSLRNENLFLFSGHAVFTFPSFPWRTIRKTSDRYLQRVVRHLLQINHFTTNGQAGQVLQPPSLRGRPEQKRD